MRRTTGLSSSIEYAEDVIDQTVDVATMADAENRFGVSKIFICGGESDFVILCAVGYRMHGFVGLAEENTRDHISQPMGERERRESTINTTSSSSGEHPSSDCY